MKTENKTSGKTFLGMPMNWDRKNIFKNYWNPSEDRIFPPKSFGVGWDINFYALLKECGILKKKEK